MADTTTNAKRTFHFSSTHYTNYHAGEAGTPRRITCTLINTRLRSRARHHKQFTLLVLGYQPLDKQERKSILIVLSQEFHHDPHHSAKDNQWSASISHS